jgi:hypothetical protein
MGKVPRAMVFPAHYVKDKVAKMKNENELDIGIINESSVVHET